MSSYTCPSNIRPLTTNYYGLIFQLASYLGVAGTTSGGPKSPPTYLGLTQDGILYCNSQVKVAAVTDGLSNTAMMGERPCTSNTDSLGWGFSPFGGSGYGDGDSVLGSTDTWLAINTCGDLSTNVGFRPQRTNQGTSTNAIDGAHFWSFHDQGMNILMGDGSVHFMSYSVGTTVFPAMCTRNGGEVFPEPF
jgi:prepilin-type processing-associated H-X9-DG protein